MPISRQIKRILYDITGTRHVPTLKARELSNPKRAFLKNAYLFSYPRPKTASKLPYFDTAPIIIILGRQSGGRVLGLNLSHIPYSYSLQIAKRIERKAKNKKRSLRYSDIKRAISEAKLPEVYYMVAIKSYLLSHISGVVYPIDIASGEYYNALKEVPRKFKKMGLSSAMAYNRNQVNKYIKKQKQK